MNARVVLIDLIEPLLGTPPGDDALSTDPLRQLEDVE